MKRLTISFLILLALLAGRMETGSLYAQNSNGQVKDAFAIAGDRVDRLLSGHIMPGTPGVAIAVLQGGEVVYQKGYGLANLEYEIPVTPSTRFHVASVSKQFTVFSVLLLAEEGRLSLDDNIRKYIREVPEFEGTITLRHLIHHTSGLRDQWDMLVMAGWRLDDIITQEQVLRMINLQRELNFSPGEKYLYSNTGYTLLAEVVKRVSGQTFADFTREHIFDPLGMTSTFFYDDFERIIPNRAYSYYLSRGQYKKSVLNYATTGATGLFTTVEDLIKWVRNFEDPVVGNKRLFKRMRSRGVLSSGDTIDYAMGQFITSYHEVQMISHTGSDAGYKAYLGRIPEKEFALILLSNDASFPESLMAQQIIDLYVEQEADHRGETGLGEGRSSPVPVNVKASDLEKYCGTYWNDKDFYLVDIHLSNDTLRFFWPANIEKPLIPAGRDTFRMPGVLSDIWVVFGQHRHPGKKLTLQVEGFEPIEFTSYLQVEYTPISLEKYTGTYFSPELATWYRFEVIDERLVATHRRHGDIPLKPFGLDLFQGNRWVFGKVKFIRDSNGQVKGCNMSLPRARDIWFDRIAR